MVQWKSRWPSAVDISSIRACLLPDGLPAILPVDDADALPVLLHIRCSADADSKNRNTTVALLQQQLAEIDALQPAPNKLLLFGGRGFEQVGGTSRSRVRGLPR
jgi:hypothetical protein